MCRYSSYPYFNPSILWLCPPKQTFDIWVHLGYTPKISQSCSFSTYIWAHSLKSFSLYFTFGRLQIDTVFKFSTNECFPTVHCMSVRKEPPKSGSCGSAKWGIRVWHCRGILGYMHARSLAIPGQNFPLTPDSDPKLHLAQDSDPKLPPSRNLCVRPRILYRTNFHKCRCCTYFEAFSRDFPAS